MNNHLNELAIKLLESDEKFYSVEDLLSLYLPENGDDNVSYCCNEWSE